MDGHDPGDDDCEILARNLRYRINEQLPEVLRQLLTGHVDLNGGQLRLECSLVSGEQTKVASINIATTDIGTPTPSTSQTPNAQTTSFLDNSRQAVEKTLNSQSVSPSTARQSRMPSYPHSDGNPRPTKRRATGSLTVGRSGTNSDTTSPTEVSVVRRLESDGKVFPQRRKRLPDNPTLQPSSFDKFVKGVWDSIFSGMHMDPAEVIEQWQAIESTGRPNLLHDTDSSLEVSAKSAVQACFGRMNALTRKISQASRTCRSLEVIVQAYWIEAFDNRVLELSEIMTKDKARKTAIAEACVDFNWTEKELRNKTAIWRGYHDIKNTGGWAALVFAGMGLYRFCKYRVSFSEDTFHRLRQLRHRFEVAADTLHPRWRSLLTIVNVSTECKYAGHPHDWVVCGPDSEAIPLATTYHKWDKNFSYVHLNESALDGDAWGMFDPRTIVSPNDPAATKCPSCDETQSDDPRVNACTCFPNLYGKAGAGNVPVQVFRTPNGKNNGLIACCPFERGAAVGEFIGQITSGLCNMDVMVGTTEQATYQIWQGKQGNHTRFVNHSCQPNSQFERFVWLGKQRIVLVSKGIEAGEEVTVDYSDTYWRDLDKECLCGQPKCRYRRRRLEPA